jgi:nitrate/nitrite transporter NarK
VSDVGSVAGGWLSSMLIQRGWTVHRARKTTLLVCALCVLPVVLVTRVGTTFVTDDAFYARLGASRVTPAEQASLRSLSGRSFGSAKEFTAAVATAVDPVTAGRLESTLVKCARSDQYYWIAVVLMGLAAAGHQGWSANLYTLVSDVFPKAATASVIGFGGMFGAVSGLIADWSLGRVLSASGPAGYLFAFLLAGSAYLFFLGVIQILMPRMTPLDDNLKHVGSHSS